MVRTHCEGMGVGGGGGMGGASWPGNGGRGYGTAGGPRTRHCRAIFEISLVFQSFFYNRGDFCLFWGGSRNHGSDESRTVVS